MIIELILRSCLTNSIQIAQGEGVLALSARFIVALMTVGLTTAFIGPVSQAQVRTTLTAEGDAEQKLTIINSSGASFLQVTSTDIGALNDGDTVNHVRFFASFTEAVTLTVTNNNPEVIRFSFATNPPTVLTNTISTITPGFGYLSGRIDILARADNDTVQGPQEYSVVLAWRPADTPAAVTGNTASVTLTGIVIDDEGGFTLVPDATLADIAEGAETTFTVVLNGQPASNVVLTLTSSDTDIATVPANLTFTNGDGDWNTPKTVTVTGGIDDNLVGGDEDYTVMVAVDAGSSDDAYDGLDAQILSGTVTDDEAASAAFFSRDFVSIPNIAEGGSTTFTYALAAQPASNVILTLTTSDTDVATVTSELTFTNSDWSTPKTATVAGVDNDIVSGDQNYAITVDVASGPGRYGDGMLGEQRLLGLIVTDNDAASAGVTLNPDPPSTLTSIAEGGRTTFTAVLAAQPSSDVVLTLTSSDTDIATVGDANVTFTNSNWNEAQTVSISGVDNTGFQGEMPYTVTIAVDSGPGAYGTLAEQELSGILRDKTAPNLILNPLSDLASIDESGETTFTVVLNMQPTSGNVVIDLTSSDTAIATVVPAQLTFTQTNWDMAQTGTVSAVDDDNIGDESYIITVAVDDANSSAEYDSLSNQLSGVVDDDAGFTLDPSDTLIGPTENGGAIRLTIVLDAQPASDVVLSITTSDTEIRFVSTEFTFTTMNWDTPQEAFIAPLRSDRIVQLPVDYTVTVGVVDASSDNDFDAVPDQTISGTFVDNDIPNLRLSDGFNPTVRTLTEGGGGRLVRMGIDAQAIPPVGIDVIVTVTTDSDEVVLTGSILATINSTNINRVRNVIVTPVDDDLVDGSQTYTLTASVVRVDGGASAYDTTISTTVTGVIDDNDMASVSVDGTNLPNSESNGYFVVSLPKGPLTNVVLDVTSSGEGLHPITPLSATKLTFTGGSGGNWNTAQTITVTAEVDNNINADETYTITVSVDEVNSDAAFDSVSVPDNLILGTILDDDVGEFTLSTNDLGTIAEAGASTSFTVVLDAQPRSNVELTLTQMGKPVSLSAATLTFTSGNWNEEQTIMVSGEDNDIQDGDLAFTITVDVDTAASDDDFNLAPTQEVSGIVSDDEVAGFKLLPLGGAVTLEAIDESSGETTFTVVLNINPTGGDVVIDVTSSDTAIATVDSAELTFTNGPTGNWDTEQTVTVTAVDDSMVLNRDYIITVAVDDAKSSDDYDSVANQELSGTVPDDGEPALTPRWATFPESVTEGEVGDPSTGIQFYTTTVLNTGSGESVGIVASPTIDDSNGGFHFQQADYTVNVADDFITMFTNFRIDNDLLDVTPIINTIMIAMSSNDPLYDGEEFRQAITVLDNDLHATISISAASFTEGASGSFTVAIPAEETSTSGEFFGGPVTDVVTTISISGLDAADYTLTPASALLTFAGGGTTGRWRDAQTVSLNIARDGTVSSPARDIEIHVAVIESESDQIFYDALTDLDYVQSASVSEVDVAGFTLLPAPATGLGTIAEGGVSTSFTAVLDASPSSGNVVLTLITTGKPVSLSATTLTFTATNWDEEQTIMVSGEDNDIPDSDLAYTITVGVDAAASNDAFDGLANQELSGTVSDDDVPGIQVNPPVNLASISEGSETTFTVVLNTQPTSGNVVIDLTASDPAIATVVPAQLTFDAGNWDRVQTGTVTAVDNDTIGDQNYMITFAIDDTNSSDEYDGLSSVLSGTIDDDETAGFTLSGTALGPIAEDGGSTSFTVILDAEPSSDVELALTTSGKAVSLSAATLTFTSGNWDDIQTIMVSGVNNDVADGDLAFMVTVAIVDASSDDNFDDVANQELSGIVTDDDDAGLTLAPDPSAGLAAIDEGGSTTTTTFTVVLNTQPASGNVVIDLTASDTAIATVVPAKLTFDSGSGNWNRVQTGTVTAVDNDMVGEGQNYMITVAVDDANSSNEYDGLSSILSGTVNEDDAGLIFESSTLADITVNSDVGTTETVKLSIAPTDTVVLTLTSSNTTVAVVSPALLTFTGGPTGNWDMEQPFTVTPGTNVEVGDGLDYTITVAVDDDNSSNEYDTITQELSGTVIDDGLSEEQTEVAIASADTFGTAQIATDLISGHLLAPPAVQPQAQLAGIALGSTTNLPVRSDLEQDPWGNDEDNAWQHDIADLIPGTEFTLPLSDTDSRGGHYEIWGAAGYSDLSGDPTSKGDKTEYDGNATGVHIGIGRRYVNGTSFGVSIGSTKVELDIDTGSGDPVKVERDLISIHPYIGWTFQDGLAAWLIAGYGDGDYEQDDEQTDASLLMLGGGVQRSWSVQGNDVAVRLEGVTTESKLDTKGNLTGESSAWQGRVEFEIARSFAAAGGGHVQPYGTFGYRYDGGDLGGSGAGEVGLGLRSQLAASWTIDVKSRFQVTDSDHERRSIQGHVKYDRDTDRRGWLFTLSNSFEYEVEDADTAAEYTRVLEGSVGYGWSRTLLRQRGTLDLHLKASRGDEQEEPVIGFGFTAPLLRLGLDGSEEEVELYFNYVYTDF